MWWATILQTAVITIYYLCVVLVSLWGKCGAVAEHLSWNVRLVSGRRHAPPPPREMHYEGERGPTEVYIREWSAAHYGTLRYTHVGCDVSVTSE